ncbi:tetratricopeptide repeat protein [Candidatus Woesearchaeota archaeon]|nr:tetratricopeptide repeat protein [Candidatus Woesearchaeota archaeon]
MGGLKKRLVIILSILTIIILAGVVLGTNIIVKTDNKDFDKDPNFYKALGNYFAEQGEYDKAIQSYETCLLLGEDIEARNNLAVLYHKQSRYTEAINQLKQLITIEPDNPSYHYDLAVNLVDKFRNTQEQDINDLTEALAEYQKTEALELGYEYAKENAEVLKEVLEQA